MNEKIAQENGDSGKLIATLTEQMLVFEIRTQFNQDKLESLL